MWYCDNTLTNCLNRLPELRDLVPRLLPRAIGVSEEVSLFFYSMDLSNYQIPQLFEDKKAPAFRFQELVLDAIKKFGIEKKWASMVWGLVGRNKKNNEEFTMFQLERAIKETEQRKPAEPSRYFIKLLITFLK